MAPRPGFVARTLDAIVTSIAPARGLQRAEARARLERGRALQAGYEAARRDRAKSSGRVGSADKDLSRDLATLRDKSRLLVRDDAHAAAAVGIKLENVVGAGITVQANVNAEEAGLTQTQADDFNGAADRLWRRWAESEDHCDANQMANFAAMTTQVYRTSLVDGETFVHRTAASRRKITTAFELIDADRIDDSYTQGDLNIRAGVEIGSNGEPIAYWVRPHHPDDLPTTPGVGSNEPERILRKKDVWPNMLHVFDRLRAGQSRGVPMIVPSLPLFEHLHHYLDSEIIAARVNANFAVFVERPVDPASDPNIMREIDGYDAGTGGGQQRWLETSTPGQIEYLNQGEKITSFGHNRPGTTFDPFVTRILRAIAASLGLPYEMIVKDFGGMNYSSARVALLEARRGFDVERARLIAQWNRPAYRTVIREGILSGELPHFMQQGQDLEPFLRARYIGPAYGWVDPVKEVQSAHDAVAANLSTPDQEAARAGMDAEDILRARARHMVIARDIEMANKLPPGALSSAAPTPIAKPSPEPGGDDIDPEDQ